MMKHLMLFAALVGCDAGARPAETTITLTSVAFADDCGGTPPAQEPALPATRTAGASAAPAVAERVADEAYERRRCEQTSMQLAIVGQAASELRIKSVEVFDEHGKSIGKLTASKPTRWDAAKAAYEPWDEKVGTGAMAVSYVLSQPTFVNTYDARDRTYTVKVIATLGGKHQPLKATVMVVGRPAPVPT